MKKLILITALVLGACGTQDPVSYNAYGVQKGAGSVGVHTVLQGDTVYKIAENYQLPIRDIISINNIEAPYVLNTGFRMKLPPPNEHKVRIGDTVQTIANMYEVSPSQIVELNNLRAPYNLRRGAWVRLPTSSTPRAQTIQPQSLATSQQAAASNARLEPVERDVIRPTAQKAVQTNAPISSGANTNNTITPDRKPTVQKASIPRAKIPKSTPRLSGNGRFMQPVEGRIISTYGPKDGGLYNDGINIKAIRGAPVRAAENGVVVYTGDDLEGYGNLILVRHENKLMSAYAHLDKTLIKRGAKVVRGQSIGTVGSTGQVDSPQLHFEIRKGSKALDPAKYL